MNLSSCSNAELIQRYSDILKELKSRGVLRTKNVVGDLGEYLVMDFYQNNTNLPNLTAVALGTKNFNAYSDDGERYSIKSTTTNTTGAIYGLKAPSSKEIEKPIFEHMIICKMDDDYKVVAIYQLSWQVFQKYKKWHSRVQAWNITITEKLKKDAKVIYNCEFNESKKLEECCEDAVVWNKTEKVKHSEVRIKAAQKLQSELGVSLKKSHNSTSRFVSTSNDSALVVASASFSKKNNEFWYSIDDEIFPWMKLYPTCNVAFCLGDAEHILLFSLDKLLELLPGCLRTDNDESKKKKGHYHFSFAVEGKQVYFKKKLPERDFINVSEYMV